MGNTHNKHLGRVCALPFLPSTALASAALASAAWAAHGAEDAPAPVVASERQDVEEVVVTDTPIEANIPTIDLIQATYEARAEGGRLYRRGQYEAALPFLLAAARKGFKWEQARVSFLYQQGYGTEQDVEAAVGWLGVAARGETTPAIRKRFKDIWGRIPEEHKPHFKAVIDGYEKRYGNEANRTVCKNRMEMFTEDIKKRIFECDFVDADLHIGIIRPFRF